MALFLQSCATKTPATDTLAKDRDGLPESHRIKTVPFIEQQTNHCGPASLAMVIKSQGRDVDLKEITQQMYTPGSKGTFSTDLTSAIRRQGMLGVPVKNLKSMLTEISSGHPVMVFQNLGFSWYPQWHYAVAVGYDLKGPDVILHSGKTKYLEEDMRLFERSWSQANYWAIVVLNPGTLAASADDLEHVGAISGLEQAGKLEEAHKSYGAVLEKWPMSLPALIGMGNVLYSKKDLKAAGKYLSLAVKFHPESAMAWHNLATVQGEMGESKAAKDSSLKAISLVRDDELLTYKESLKAWLP